MTQRLTRHFRLLAAILAAGWLATLAGCASGPLVDTLYTGDNILTMDPAYANATAVAVTGDTITWVGRKEDWRGQAKRQVALGEHSLVPGLIDAHGHLEFLARTVNMANVASPPVGPATDIKSLQATLRLYLRNRKLADGDWLLGLGYDDSLLKEQRHPTRDELDAVSTTHAIALTHVSGHLATANSLALARAGISAATPDPAGGKIRRRPGSNEPNGVLEEAAAFGLRLALPAAPLSAADLDAALQVYASHGITTVQDGASNWPAVAAVQDIAASTTLPLDVVFYPLMAGPDATPPPDTIFGGYNNRVKLGGIKLVLDGSPQGKTAYLSAPYLHPPHGQHDDYRGYPLAPQEVVNIQVDRFTSAGIPIIAHANGDAAAQMLLDALDNAAASHPLGDHRTVMIHAQTVREDQLDRMQALAVVPSYFSAHTFYWGDWHRDSVFGPERANRISPTRSTLDRGMPFTVHNDAPIVPPDMVRLLWATSNRITRSGQVLGPEQRIPALESLRAMTSNAAYQYFEEANKGSLSPGKQADLVILSANPTTMDPGNLLELQVLETVAQGVTVFTLGKPTEG